MFLWVYSEYCFLQASVIHHIDVERHAQMYETCSIPALVTLPAETLASMQKKCLSSILRDSLELENSLNLESYALNKWQLQHNISPFAAFFQVSSLKVRCLLVYITISSLANMLHIGGD